MIITLIGYMGSGKSFIGNQLANHLAIPFFDLDSLIEEKEQTTIATLFKEKGEVYFRKLEHTTLLETLNRTDDFVLALGGGTPCFYNNMEYVNKKSVSFYLQNSIATLTERLENEKEQRPIISHLNNEQLPEFIAKHLFERRLFYEKATHTIKVDQQTIEETLQQIEETILKK